MDNPEYFAPSEIARLILGYLKENNLHKTFSVFLRECPDLAEYWRLLQTGKLLSTNILGYSLTQILNEFATLKLNAVSAGQSRVRPVVSQAQQGPSNSSHTPTEAAVRASLAAAEKARHEKEQRRVSRQKQRAAFRSKCNQTVPQTTTDHNNDGIAAVHDESIPGISGTQEQQDRVDTPSPLENTDKDGTILDSAQKIGGRSENNSPQNGKRGKRQRSRPRKKSLLENKEHTQIGKEASEPSVTFHPAVEGDRTLPVSSNTGNEFDFLDKLLEDTHLHEKLAENINKAMKGSLNLRDNNAEDIQEANTQAEAGVLENPEINIGKKVDISTIIEMTESDPAFQNFLKLFQHGSAIPISHLDVPEFNFSAVNEPGVTEHTGDSSPAINAGNKDSSVLIDEHSDQPNSSASNKRINSVVVSSRSNSPNVRNSDYQKNCQIGISSCEGGMNQNCPSEMSSHVAVTKNKTDDSYSQVSHPISGKLESKTLESPVCSESVQDQLQHTHATCVQTSISDQDHEQNNLSSQNLYHTIAAGNQENSSEVAETSECWPKESTSLTPLDVPTETKILSIRKPELNSFVPPDENSMSVFSLIAKNVEEMTGEKFAHSSEENSFTSKLSDNVSTSNADTDTKTDPAAQTRSSSHNLNKIASINEKGNQIPSTDTEVGSESQIFYFKKEPFTALTDEISRTSGMEVNHGESLINNDSQSEANPDSPVTNIESNGGKHVDEFQNENTLHNIKSELNATNGKTASNVDGGSKEMQGGNTNTNVKADTNITDLKNHTGISSGVQDNAGVIRQAATESDTSTLVPRDMGQTGEASSSLPCVSTSDAVLVTPIGFIKSVVKENLNTIDTCLSNCLAPLAGDQQVERLLTVAERGVSEDGVRTGTKVSTRPKERKKRRVNIITLQYASKKSRSLSDNLDKLSDNTNNYEELLNTEPPVNFTSRCVTLSSPPSATVAVVSDDNSPRKITKGISSFPSCASLPATFTDWNLPNSTSFKSPSHTHSPSAFRPVGSRQSSITQAQENSSEGNQSPSVSKSTTKTVIAVNSEQAPFIPAHCKKNPSRRINPVEVSYSTPSPLQDFPASPMSFVIDLPPSEPNSPCVPVRDSENPTTQGMPRQIFSPEFQRNKTGPSLPSCSYTEQNKKTPISSQLSEKKKGEEESSSVSISPLEKLGIPMPLSPSKRKPRRVVPVQLSSAVNKGWSSLVRSVSPIKPPGDDAKTVSSTSDIQTDSHSEIEAFRMLKSFLSVSYSKPQPKQEITSSNQVSGITSSKPTPMSKCGCVSKDMCKHRKGKVKKHLTPKKLVLESDDGSEVVKGGEGTKAKTTNVKAKKSLGNEFGKVKKSVAKDEISVERQVCELPPVNEKTGKDSTVLEVESVYSSGKLLDGKNVHRNGPEMVIESEDINSELVEAENIHCVKNGIIKGLIESENRSHSPASVNSEGSAKSFKVVGVVEVDKDWNDSKARQEDNRQTNIAVNSYPPTSYHSTRKINHPTCSIVLRKGCQISPDRYNLAVSELNSFTSLTFNRTQEYRTECLFETEVEDLTEDSLEYDSDRMRQVSAGSSDDPAQKLNTGMINVSVVSNSSESEKDQSKESKGEKVKKIEGQISASVTTHKTKVSENLSSPGVSKSTMAENCPNSIPIIDRLSEAQNVRGLFTSTPVSSKAKQHSAMVYSSSRKSQSLTTAAVGPSSSPKANSSESSESVNVKSLDTNVPGDGDDISKTPKRATKSVCRKKISKMHGYDVGSGSTNVIPMSNDKKTATHTKTKKKHEADVLCSLTQADQKTSTMEASGEIIQECNMNTSPVIVSTVAATTSQPIDVNSSHFAATVKSTDINSLPVVSVSSDNPVPVSNTVYDSVHQMGNPTLPVSSSHTAFISSTYATARGSIYGPLPSSIATPSAGIFTSLLNRPMSSEDDINNMLSDDTGLSDCISGALRVAHDIGMSPLKSCNPNAQINSGETVYGTADNGLPTDSPNSGSILGQAMRYCNIAGDGSQATNSEEVTNIPKNFHTMSTSDAMGHIPRQIITPASDALTPILPKLSILKTAKEREEETKLQLLSQAFSFQKIAPKPPSIAKSLPDATSVPLCQIQVIQSTHGPVVTLPPEYQGIFSKLLNDIGAPSSVVDPPSPSPSFSTAATSDPIPAQTLSDVVAICAESMTPSAKKKSQGEKHLKMLHNTAQTSVSPKNVLTPKSKKIKTRTRKILTEGKKSDSEKAAHDVSIEKRNKNKFKSARKIADRKSGSLGKSPILLSAASQLLHHKWARDGKGRFASRKPVSPSNQQTCLEKETSVLSVPPSKCGSKSFKPPKKARKTMEEKSPISATKLKSRKKSLTSTGKMNDDKPKQSNSHEKSKNLDGNTSHKKIKGPVKRIKDISKNVCPSSVSKSSENNGNKDWTENQSKDENINKRACDERVGYSPTKDVSHQGINQTISDQLESVSCHSTEKITSPSTNVCVTSLESGKKGETTRNIDVSSTGPGCTDTANVDGTCTDRSSNGRNTVIGNTEARNSNPRRGDTRSIDALMDFESKKNQTRVEERGDVDSSSTDSEDDLPLSNFVNKSSFNKKSKSKSQLGAMSSVAAIPQEETFQHCKKHGKGKAASLSLDKKKSRSLQDREKHVNSADMGDNSVIDWIKEEEETEDQVYSHSALKGTKSTGSPQKETRSTQGVASVPKKKNRSSPKSEKSKRTPSSESGRSTGHKKTLFEIIEGLSTKFKYEPNAQRKRKNSKCDGTPRKRRRKSSSGAGKKPGETGDSSDEENSAYEEESRLNTSATVKDLNPTRRFCNMDVRMVVDLSSGEEIRIGSSEESHSLEEESRLNEQNRSNDNGKETEKMLSPSLEDKLDNTRKVNSPKKNQAGKVEKAKGAKSPLKYMGSVPLFELKDFLGQGIGNIPQADTKNSSRKSSKKCDSGKPAMEDEEGSRNCVNKYGALKVCKVGKQKKSFSRKDKKGSVKLSNESGNQPESDIDNHGTASQEKESEDEIQTSEIGPLNYTEEEIETASAIANLRFCMGEESSTTSPAIELSIPDFSAGHESQLVVMDPTSSENPTLTSTTQEFYQEKKTPTSPLKHFPFKKRLSMEIISSDCDNEIMPEGNEKTVNENQLSPRPTESATSVSTRTLFTIPVSSTHSPSSPSIDTSMSRTQNQFELPPQSLLNSRKQHWQSTSASQGLSQEYSSNDPLDLSLPSLTLPSTNTVFQEQNHYIQRSPPVAGNSTSFFTEPNNENTNCQTAPKPIESELVSPRDETESVSAGSSVLPQSLSLEKVSESKHLSHQKHNHPTLSRIPSRDDNRQPQTLAAFQFKTTLDSADVSSLLEVSSTMSSPQSDSLSQGSPSGKSVASKSKIEKLLKKLHRKKKA